MDPRRFLDEVCRRHGVAPPDAEPLLPLVQLAWAARPSVRRRILQQVEEALARQAPAVPPSAALIEGEEADRRLLQLVARVLHRWKLGPA